MEPQRSCNLAYPRDTICSRALILNAGILVINNDDNNDDDYDDDDHKNNNNNNNKHHTPVPHSAQCQLTLYNH